MSHGNYTVTLQLSETPTDILERELRSAEESARRCDAQGTPRHAWGPRITALRTVLEARRRREAPVADRVSQSGARIEGLDR